MTYDGSFTTYAFDKTIYRFDPLTGFRKRIHNYNEKWDGKIGDTKVRFMPEGTKYFSYHNVLYAVSGHKLLPTITDSHREKNTIFVFEDNSNTWRKLLNIEFDVRIAHMSEGRIFIAGQSNAAVYDIQTKDFFKANFPFQEKEITAVAALPNAWAIGLLSAKDGKVLEDTSSEILIASMDLSMALQNTKLENFGRIKISTHSTPVPSQ